MLTTLTTSSPQLEAQLSATSFEALRAKWESNSKIPCVFPDAPMAVARSRVNRSGELQPPYFRVVASKVISMTARRRALRLNRLKTLNLRLNYRIPYLVLTSEKHKRKLSLFKRLKKTSDQSQCSPLSPPSFSVVASKVISMIPAAQRLEQSFTFN